MRLNVSEGESPDQRSWGKVWAWSPTTDEVVQRDELSDSREQDTNW